MVDLSKSASWNKMETLQTVQTSNRGWSNPPRDVKEVKAGA